ncbi:dynein regulatory complex subunit 7 [Aplysia californica]|uniref:Dynein regulatory complex subunit 7 n=1 Tax=Aplysia californica TaxID=6500 RepID=A0ABM0ZZS6_APLCA|nr:dynein regulatory complex subunit 7 [Aplysia californica]
MAEAAETSASTAHEDMEKEEDGEEENRDGHSNVSSGEKEGEEGTEEEEDEKKDDEEGDDGSEGEDGAESLKEELNKIQVESPKPTEPVFDPSKFPPSYKDNNPKEQKAIRLCKMAIKQFRDLYFDRRPLFLKPLNEFGVQKLVCTTISPTQLPYKDLLDWPDVAEFVAGYLSYDPLQPPHMLPEHLYAPQTVLERQRGHCFEYSTLLCSMLIGSGYDAYVVSGYASREVCNIDLTYTPCPLIEQDQKVYTQPASLNIRRYTVRPPRKLASVYMLRMKRKEDAIKKKFLDEKIELEEKERALKEAPPPDPLKGWRVHSWVMVLKGLRDVTETFFIEPTTGVSHPTDWGQYLGIESIWNHLNYYINCHREAVNTKVPVTKLTVPAPMLLPVGKMNFDIGDSCYWDFLFNWQNLHRKKTDEELREEQRKGDNCTEETFFDLPLSWTQPLYVHRDDYDMKFPTGKKTIKYKGAVVESYAYGLNPDGMVRKLWVYHDVEGKILRYSKETFASRADLLETRYLEHPTTRVVEQFATGRADYLRVHDYYAQTPGPQSKRTLVFEKGGRRDGLQRKEEGPDFMKLFYGEFREDKKYYKEVRFGPLGKVRESSASKDARPIEVIEECFRRNPEVPANENIARARFSVLSDEMDVEYHVEKDRISFSTRHFTKPPLWWDETQVLTWSPFLHWNYEVDQCVRPKCELELYNLLISLMAMEAKTREQTRAAERETASVLRQREKEAAQPVLLKNYSQAHRVPATREARLDERAREKAARILKRSDILRDYLEPNIQRLGLGKVTNKKQASKVRDDCLGDLKECLLTQINMMKEDFEKEKALIVTLQTGFHKNFILLSQEEEEKFRVEVSQHMFVAHILERRINTFKEYAPMKYQALCDTLARDPRLEPYLI